MKKESMSFSTLEKQVRETLFDLVTHIPQPRVVPEGDVVLQIIQLIKEASFRSAALSGLLSLPPGPLGMLTVVPDMIVVWRLQSQLIADIAHLCGTYDQLDRDSMIFCLFSNGQSNIQDLLVRAGERVGLRIGRRFLGEGLARWAPLVGAFAVARYTKGDTTRVGENAVGYFGSNKARAEVELVLH